MVDRYNSEIQFYFPEPTDQQELLAMCINPIVVQLGLPAGRLFNSAKDWYKEVEEQLALPTFRRVGRHKQEGTFDTSYKAPLA